MPPYRPDQVPGDGRGQKRRRDDDYPDLSHKDAVMTSIIRVGDVSEAEAAVSGEREKALDHTQRRLSRALHTYADTIQQTILDCAVELSTKTLTYATLIGLMNADNHAFVSAFLEVAREDFDRSLAAADTNRSRMLLRLFAALAAVNVLHPTSVLAALQSLVDAASSFLESGQDPLLWQPYADFLVGATLMALPWGGSEVAESAPDQIALLFSAAEAYVVGRPRKHQPGLQPFLHASEADDPAAQSDSGGASFLDAVWKACVELRESGNWAVAGIPRPTWVQFEAQLAEGTPHELAPLTIPVKPPGAPADLPTAVVAAAVLEAFPPRGSIALLPLDQTQGGKTAMERLIMEQYILDTIHYFDGDRVQCARKLALGLPIKEGLEALLAEVLFSQMLCLPRPPLKPLAYSAIMVDVCKLLAKFPRPMSACVRECFLRVGALDPELRSRLAAWLAVHLSNFDFMWPWERWRHVLEGPPHDAQRRFVASAILQLVRLSYLDKVKGFVPASLSQLLPPVPEIVSYATPSGADAPANGLHDDPAANGNLAGAEDIPVVEQTLARIRMKLPSEAMLAWLREQAGLQPQLASADSRLRIVAKAILTAGAKSLTHLSTYLQRYQPLLGDLLQDAGPQAQHALIALVVEAWQAAPLRALHAIDGLLDQRLVSAAAVVRWAFASPGLLTLADGLSNDMAWEAVDTAVAHATAHTQESTEALQPAQQKLAAAQHRAQEAADYADRMDVDVEVATAQQEKATAAAAEAEDAVAVQAAAAKQALAEQNALLLLVFQQFLAVLTDGKAHVKEAGSDEGLREEREAWQADALAHLRSFARRWHVAVAPLAPELDSKVFAEEHAAPDLRAALLSSVYL